MKRFIVGFILGSMIFGIGSVLAYQQIIASENHYPVKVDGKDVFIEGYSINGYTYFKLRDIARAVGGFDVDFKDETILIETDENRIKQDTSLHSDYIETDTDNIKLSNIEFSVPTGMSVYDKENDKIYIGDLGYIERYVCGEEYFDKPSQTYKVFNTHEDYEDYIYDTAVSGKKVIRKQFPVYVDFSDLFAKKYDFVFGNEDSKLSAKYYVYGRNGICYTFAFFQEGDEWTQSNEEAINTIISTVKFEEENK